MRLNGYEPRFIALADVINGSMPAHIVSLVADALNDEGRAVKDANILVLGVAYKAGVGDTRESPAHEIIASLRRRGAHVAYADPHVPAFVVDDVEVKAVELTDATIEEADCIVLLANHLEFDLRRIADIARLVVDTRSATWGLDAPRARIVRL
jgi:UDP-N-acetyl-D-glucosamine dehydrogenase